MKAATKPIEVTTTTGDAITINVPVGSMDRPTAICERIMEQHQDPRGWKYPIKPFVTGDKSLAEDYGYCLDWFVGGHETIETWTTDGPQWVVASKGYYHYIGA